MSAARANIPMIRLTKQAERRVRDWARDEEEMSREEGAADWAMFVRAYDQLVEENARLNAHLHWVACQIGFATDEAIAKYVDKALAQGGEARGAETPLGGSVADEHPGAEGDAP